MIIYVSAILIPVLKCIHGGKVPLFGSQVPPVPRRRVCEDNTVPSCWWFSSGTGVVFGFLSHTAH